MALRGRRRLRAEPTAEKAEDFIELRKSFTTFVSAWQTVFVAIGFVGDTVDTLIGSVAAIGPELAQALAVATDARRILGLTGVPAPETVPAQRARAGGQRPRRRSLGPGYQGLAGSP
ncbi:hypothetical protein ACFY5F_29580 [Streptomyces sp. NPDC013161]|uniref:hypothetical protein n=1 Tax=Streptomyces sp. NPDC013161 TaxID=3364862 RepID=UPI0036AD5125